MSERHRMSLFKKAAPAKKATAKKAAAKKAAAKTPAGVGERSRTTRATTRHAAPAGHTLAAVEALPGEHHRKLAKVEALPGDGDARTLAAYER